VSTLDLSGKTILLVEDVTFIRDIIFKLFLSFGRPEIVQAANGQEALDILASGRFKIDYAISDFNMPKVHGLELLKAVRMGKRDIERNIPFAMLTAYSDVDLVDAALSLDVNAFLVKPVSKATLEDRFGKLVEKAGDASWLKPPVEYSAVNVQKVMEKVAENLISKTKEPEKAVLYEEKTATGGGKPAKPAKPASSQTSKKPRYFTDADLAAPPRKIRQFTKEEVEKGVQAEIAMPVLFGNRRFNNDRSAKEQVSRRVNRVIKEVTPEAAAYMFQSLDEMVSTGRLEPEDTLELLKDETPDLGTEVPPGAKLKNDAYTIDGNVFLKTGTPLTKDLLALMIKLDKLGILSLKQIADGMSGRRDAKDRTSASEQDRKPVPEKRCNLDQVRIGDTVARDLMTFDGRVYIGWGQTLTEKSLSKLNIAQELGHIEDEIWIEDRP